MISMPGGMEWIIILVIVLVLFGGRKLPELMGGLGKGIRNFKKGVASDETEEPKPVDNAGKVRELSEDEKQS